MERGIFSSIELKSWQGRLYYFVSIVILLVLAIVVIFPFVYAFTSGLKGSTEIFESGLNLLPEKAQWENYEDAWTNFRMARLVSKFFVYCVIRSCDANGRFYRSSIFPITIEAIWPALGYARVSHSIDDSCNCLFGAALCHAQRCAANQWSELAEFILGFVVAIFGQCICDLCAKKLL